MKKITVKPAFILTLLFCAVIIFFLIILAYIVIYKVISCAGFLIISLMVTGLSQIFRSRIKTVIAASFIILVPFLLDYSGFGALGFINVTYFLVPVYADRNIVTYIFCTALTLAIYMKARFAWSKD